jgi:blue copper oxidase
MKKSILSIVTIAISIFTFSLSSCMKMDNMNMQNMNMKGVPVPVTEGSFTAALAIPAVTGSSTTLTAKNVTANINGFGNTAGLGYTASGLLGPTIKINSGSVVNVNFVNQLNEKSNIHWHGLKVPANMDGHPENVVNAGGSFNYNFTINQRAGMYWYHPHPDMITGKQVFQGLAGLFIVNDADETALNLPSGNRELPLVIQDKRISGGSIPYSPSMMEQMTGYMGQYVLVNGVYAPVHNVETAKYRVRILNGSNARIYNLALSNAVSFTLIGNDGGLLASPQTVNSLLVGPGERADLIIDFSTTALNSELFLISKTFNGGDAQGTQEFKIMKFKTTSQVTDNFTIPSTLSSLLVLAEGSATKTRNFDIQNTVERMDGDMMTHKINDKVFEMNRIDESVTMGATEVWVFDNTNGLEPHPMHLHGVQFQILSRTGGRGALTPLESGWKDMALCMPGEKVKIIIPFTVSSGKYVFHCHNLEHEDTGMMGQFQVN